MKKNTYKIRMEWHTTTMFYPHLMPQKVQVAYENEYSNNDQGAFYRASIFHMAVTLDQILVGS